MSVKSCLPIVLAVLLAQGVTAAAAETPLASLPDPVAPAVIGRPLEQIGPVRKPGSRAAATASGSPAARPGARAPTPAAGKATASAARAPARPAAPKQAQAQPKPAVPGTAGAPRSAAAPKALPPQAVLGGPGLPPGPPPGAASPEEAAPQRLAKQALYDRADPRMRLDDVGKGIHFARKALGPGAYFGSKDRATVRKYYAEHPAPAAGAHWEIGQPVPRGPAVTAVPKTLRAYLPKLPPGHRYVQVGGEVVLIAEESRMVVDGISRSQP